MFLQNINQTILSKKILKEKNLLHLFSVVHDQIYYLTL